MTPYTQITDDERYALSVLRQHGCTPAEIARALGRHRSTNQPGAAPHWVAVQRTRVRGGAGPVRHQ